MTILIRKNDFACPASIADKARNHEKITVLFNTVVREVSGDDGLRRIQYQNTATGEITDYQSPDGETIGVFVFAGYAPDTALVSDIVERDEWGISAPMKIRKPPLRGFTRRETSASSPAAGHNRRVGWRGRGGRAGKVLRGAAGGSLSLNFSCGTIFQKAAEKFLQPKANFCV